MLLSPIKTILKEAGIIPAAGSRTKIGEILDSRGLTLERTADSLLDSFCSMDENVKFRATELGFKLHGVLKEAADSPPTITFIIQGENNQIANILTPRREITQ